MLLKEGVSWEEAALRLDRPVKQCLQIADTLKPASRWLNDGDIPLPMPLGPDPRKSEKSSTIYKRICRYCHRPFVTNDIGKYFCCTDCRTSASANEHIYSI